MFFLRLFSRAYNPDFLSRTTRRTFTALASASSVENCHDNQHLRFSVDGLNWVEDLLRQHVPELEVRRAPRIASASFFVRFRDERCRYNPSVTWQALSVKSTDGQQRMKKASSEMHFRFDQRSASSQAVGAGLLLTCPSEGLMWVMEPTTITLIFGSVP